MKRKIPNELQAGKYKYITTIVGEGGRAEDLEKVIRSIGIDEENRISLFGSARVYWSYFDPMVEFDVYINQTSEGTRTRSFRTGVGELLTSLLQCGYTIYSQYCEDIPDFTVEEYDTQLDF